MPQKTIIIHGWSDQAQSFVGLKNYLSANGYSPDAIYYGDWLSREDNITYGDVAAALNQEFHNREFIDENGCKKVDLNVIVHSTGGLIIRQWIAQYYFLRDDDTTLAQDLSRCPINNIVMLAPANFGSPLAEMGKSWIGGIVKGTHQLDLSFFATGRQILNGLELGSEYQWKLAQNDLMRAYPYYSSSGIQTTILVGMTGYGGLKGFFSDKEGSDGTVVISGCNLNSVKYSLVPPSLFTTTARQSTWQYFNPSVEVAYCTLPGLNHHTITDTANTGSYILEALKIGASSNRTLKFKDMVDSLNKESKDAYGKPDAPKQYQQFLVHVQDDMKIDIKDFSLEFLIIRKNGFDDLVAGNRGLDAKEQPSSIDFQHAMTNDVNSYSQNTSYRSFLLDIAAAKSIVEKAKNDFGEEPIPALRVYVPEVDDHIYYDLNSLHIVALDAGIAAGNQGSVGNNKKPDFVYPNTTTLIEINVRRISKDTVWVETTPTLHK